MTYTGTSIVDYLNSVGKPSSLSARSALASQYGISNYTGTAAQNTQLLNALRSAPASTVGTSSAPNMSTNSGAVYGGQPFTLPATVGGMSSAPKANSQPAPNMSTNSGPVYGGTPAPAVNSQGQTVAQMVAQAYANSNQPYTPPATTTQQTYHPPANNSIAPGLPGGPDPAMVVTGPSQNSSGGSGLPSTGDPALDKAQDALNNVLQSNLANGNTVNPALQITPDLVAQFLQQAHSVVDPYSQQVLTNAITGINQSLKNMNAQYQAAQGNQQAQFQQSLDKERNDAGANGIAFSGNRGLAENYMLGTQNRALASLDAQYALNAGNALRTAAGQVGNNNYGLNGSTSSFQLPDFVSQTATLEGARGGVQSNGGLNFNYDPSQYGIGSLGSAYQNALANQSNQFLSNYQKSASNNTGTTTKTFQPDANGNLTLQ